MADKGPKKGEVATTEVIIGYFILGSSFISNIAIVDPNEGLPDEIGRVNDDGLFAEADEACRMEDIRYHARHTFTKGDTIYALQVETIRDRFIQATKVWICTERATAEETGNDICRKVSLSYKNTLLEASECEGLYAELSSPAATHANRRIYDSNGCVVGNARLIKLKCG